MQRRRFAWIALICFCATALAGCGDSGKPTLTVMYWTTYGASPQALDAAVARFRAAHKTLDVTESQTPAGSSYYEKLLVTFGAQSPPDVFFIDPTMLLQYASRGGLVDLTARYRGAHLAATTHAGTCTYGGKVYGVRVGAVCYAISAPSHYVSASWDLIVDLVRAGYPTR